MLHSRFLNEFSTLNYNSINNLFSILYIYIYMNRNVKLTKLMKIVNIDIYNHRETNCKDR